MIQTLLLFLILVVLIIKTFTIEKESICKLYYEDLPYDYKIKYKREVIFFYLVMHRSNKIYKFKIFTSKGIKKYE